MKMNIEEMIERVKGGLRRLKAQGKVPGNVQELARLLGVSKAALYNAMNTRGQKEILERAVRKLYGTPATPEAWNERMTELGAEKARPEDLAEEAPAPPPETYDDRMTEPIREEDDDDESQPPF